MITYELKRGWFHYKAIGNSQINLCTDGLARFFRCSSDKLEERIFMTVSTEPFTLDRGNRAYKITLKHGCLQLKDSEYIQSWTRGAIAEDLGSRGYYRNAVLYVAFEVYA